MEQRRLRPSRGRPQDRLPNVTPPPQLVDDLQKRVRALALYSRVFGSQDLLSVVARHMQTPNAARLAKTAKLPRAVVNHVMNRKEPFNPSLTWLANAGATEIWFNDHDEDAPFAFVDIVVYGHRPRFQPPDRAYKYQPKPTSHIAGRYVRSAGGGWVHEARSIGLFRYAQEYEPVSVVERGRSDSVDFDQPSKYFTQVGFSRELQKSVQKFNDVPMPLLQGYVCGDIKISVDPDSIDLYKSDFRMMFLMRDDSLRLTMVHGDVVTCRIEYDYMNERVTHAYCKLPYTPVDFRMIRSLIDTMTNAQTRLIAGPFDVNSYHTIVLDTLPQESINQFESLCRDSLDTVYKHADFFRNYHLKHHPELFDSPSSTHPIWTGDFASSHFRPAHIPR